MSMDRSTEGTWEFLCDRPRLIISGARTPPVPRLQSPHSNVHICAMSTLSLKLVRPPLFLPLSSFLSSPSHTHTKRFSISTFDRTDHWSPSGWGIPGARAPGPPGITTRVLCSSLLPFPHALSRSRRPPSCFCYRAVHGPQPQTALLIAHGAKRTFSRSLQCFRCLHSLPPSRASPSPQRSSTLISPCHAPSIVPLAWCRCGRFFGVFLGMHGFVFAVWECLLNAVRSGEIVTLHLDGGGEFRESARVWRVLSGCSVRSFE